MGLQSYRLFLMAYSIASSRSSARTNFRLASWPVLAVAALALAIWSTNGGDPGSDPGNTLTDPPILKEQGIPHDAENTTRETEETVTAPSHTHTESDHFKFMVCAAVMVAFPVTVINALYEWMISSRKPAAAKEAEMATHEDAADTEEAESDTESDTGSFCSLFEFLDDEENKHTRRTTARPASRDCDSEVGVEQAECDYTPADYCDLIKLACARAEKDAVCDLLYAMMIVMGDKFTKLELKYFLRLTNVNDDDKRRECFKSMYLCNDRLLPLYFKDGTVVPVSFHRLFYLHQMAIFMANQHDFKEVRCDNILDLLQDCREIIKEHETKN